MKTTTSNLIRGAGLCAVVAGILFIVIQTIHPPGTLAAVTTSMWTVVHTLSVAMCVFWLLGITGLYTRQVQQTGLLGLAGYLALSLFLVLTAAFTFAEAFILPVLATEAPTFALGFLGIESGSTGSPDVAILSILYSITGVLYLLGGLLFGIATFRARILPRWAGGLLAAGTLAPLVLSILLPHEFIRLAAVPVGLALAWLGYALWSERRDNVSERSVTLATAAP